MSSVDPHKRLSLLVKSVGGLPNQIRFERRGHKLGGRSSLDQIDHCAQALLAGALPDADTLLFVATAFYRYVHSDGKLSLDQAFKLKSKPRAGNPARQAAQRQKLLTLLGRMAMMRGCDQKMSLEKAAEIALYGGEMFKVETLVREYRNRGYKKQAEGWAKYKAQTVSGK
jgi:hypothetical protein